MVRERWGSGYSKVGRYSFGAVEEKLVLDSFVLTLILQNYEDEMVYGNGFGGGAVDGLYVLLKRRGFNCSTC